MAAKVKSAATTRRANPSLAAGGNGCRGDEVEASASRLHPPRADAVVASCSRCGSSLHRKAKCPTEILYHYLDLDGPVDLLSATARFTNIDRDVEATRGVRLRLPLLLGSMSNFEITHQVCAFLSWREIAFSLMNLNAEFRLALHRFFSSFLTSQGLWYRTGEGQIRFSAAASSSGVLRPVMPLAALRAVARHGHADFALSLHGLRGDNRCRVQTIDIEVPDRSTQPQDGHIVSAGTRWATQRLYRLMQGSEVLYSTVPGEALVMVTPMSDSGRCIIRRKGRRGSPVRIVLQYEHVYVVTRLKLHFCGAGLQRNHRVQAVRLDRQCVKQTATWQVRRNECQFGGETRHLRIHQRVRGR